MPTIDIKHNGQRTVSTLAGEIKIEEGRGRMVIRDPETQTELQVHDREGSHYNNDDGDEMNRIDREGLKTFDLDNGGLEILRAGKFPGNNGYGFAVAEEGESIDEAIT